jgi:hypothetical protein
MCVRGLCFRRQTDEPGKREEEDKREREKPAPGTHNHANKT